MSNGQGRDFPDVHQTIQKLEKRNVSEENEHSSVEPDKSVVKDFLLRLWPKVTQCCKAIIQVPLNTWIIRQVWVMIAQLALTGLTIVCPEITGAGYAYGAILYFLQGLIILSFLCASTSKESKYIYNLGKKKNTYIADFLEGEHMLRLVRMINFAYAVLSLAVYPPQYKRFTPYPIAMRVCVITNAAIICLCSVQHLLRLTFRRWPNFIISAGNAILYLTVFEILDSDSDFLGLFSFSIQSAVKRIEEMEIPFVEILAFIGVSAFVVEAYKKTVSGVYEEDPKSVMQGRKRTRRKLLGHWCYRYNKIIFSGENVVVWLLVGTAVYVLVFLCAIRDFRADAAYLAIVASACYLSGILAHWNIDNDRLIQSEYSYLLTMGGKLEKKDVRDATVRWRDFCQVLVEFYSNASSVNSEDHYFHDIGNLLINIWESLKDDPCVLEKFICDILQAKGDVNAKIIRESSFSEDPQKASNAPKSSDLIKAQDILFSSDIDRLLNYYINSSLGSTCKNYDGLRKYRPLELLIQASNWFFDKQEEEWTLRFSGCGIGVEEGVCLLKIDTLINLLQMHSHKECALFWLDCSVPVNEECNENCDDCSRPCEVPENCRNLRTKAGQTSIDQQFINRCMAARMELLINYPMFVRQSFGRRWKEQFNSAYYTDDCKSYYWNLYENKLFAGSQKGTESGRVAYKQVFMAIKRVIGRLIESNEDCEFVEGFGNVLSEGKDPRLSEERFREARDDVFLIICPSDDEYASLSAENKKIVEEWNAYKEKYQTFNKKELKDDNKAVRNEVDCDMVFKVAYHLFYNSEQGG